MVSCAAGVVRAYSILGLPPDVVPPTFGERERLPHERTDRTAGASSARSARRRRSPRLLAAGRCQPTGIAAAHRASRVRALLPTLAVLLGKRVPRAARRGPLGVRPRPSLPPVGYRRPAPPRPTTPRFFTHEGPQIVGLNYERDYLRVTPARVAAPPRTTR